MSVVGHKGDYVVRWSKSRTSEVGLLDKLLQHTRAHQPQAVQSLRDSIDKLRLTIFALLFHKYAEYGDTGSKFLAVAVFNEAMRESPQNKEAEQYLNRNRILITKEALTLAQDNEAAEALSYLYAAHILYNVYLTQSPDSEPSRLLAERAGQLGLYVPNTYDICGTDDVNACVVAIAEYARGEG
jgi:hypothetical protein